MNADEPSLVRYWFEFDLADHEPDPRAGPIQLDGGPPVRRLLARGAGVTGYDEADCLGLLRTALRGEPPPLRAQRNLAIDQHQARQAGNIAWRRLVSAAEPRQPTTT